MSSYKIEKKNYEHQMITLKYTLIIDLLIFKSFLCFTFISETRKHQQPINRCKNLYDNNIMMNFI